MAYLNLGDAYAQGGDKAQASKAYSLYLGLQPQGPGADYARAQMGL